VETGPKPQLVQTLGATYHTGRVASIGFQPDVIVECTGAGQVIADSLNAVAAGGVVCLTGVGSGGRTVGLPLADAATQIVLRNNVVVGSVNANKRHWYSTRSSPDRTDGLNGGLDGLYDHDVDVGERDTRIQRHPEGVARIAAG
jgi:hypothetical protein